MTPRSRCHHRGGAGACGSGASTGASAGTCGSGAGSSGSEASTVSLAGVGVSGGAGSVGAGSSRGSRPLDIREIPVEVEHRGGVG